MSLVAFRPPLRATRETRTVLLRDGIAAREDVAAGRLTDTVENVIEANVLLSGIGFENGGGMRGCPRTARRHHGTRRGARIAARQEVAVGLIVQLVLERRPPGELTEVLDFCTAVGLPTSLTALGVRRDLRAAARVVTEAALAPGESTYATPAQLSVESIVESILEAEEIAASARVRPPAT